MTEADWMKALGAALTQLQHVENQRLCDAARTYSQSQSLPSDAPDPTSRVDNRTAPSKDRAPGSA